MPGFQFDYYKSPYTGSIADLIRRPYDAQADSARRRGDIAAQQAQVIPQLVQQASGTLTDLLKYRRDEPLRTAQIAHLDAQAEEDRAQAAERTAAVQAKRDAEGNKKILDSAIAAGESTPDIEEMLRKAGRPDLIPAARDRIAETATKRTAMITASQKYDESANDYIGTWAQNVKTFGYTPSVIQSGIEDLRRTFKEDPAILQRINDTAAKLEADPTQAKAVIDGLVALRKPSAAQTREIKHKNADGTWTIEIVEDRAGQSFTTSVDVTFGAPQQVLVNGQLDFAQRGNDGKWYDMNSQALPPDSVRPIGDKAPGADDPELPRGVQDFLLKITQHPGITYEQAQAQLNATLPELRRDHPKLDTVKAHDALRKFFAPDPAKPTLYDQFMAANPDMAGQPATPAGTPAASPRAAAPAAPAPSPEEAVRGALQAEGPGRYTFSDGSVWEKDAQGAIRKVQ